MNINSELFKSISKDLSESIIKKENKEKISNLKVIVAEIQRNTNITSDEQVINILKNLVKLEKERLSFLSESSSLYLEILNNYLPIQATREEVENFIRDNINFSNYKNKFQSIKDIKKHFSNRVDGNLIKDILEEI